MENFRWESVQQDLKQIIPSHLYSSLVERTSGLIDSGQLTLSFPDQFTKEAFEEKCLENLKQILTEKGFCHLKLMFQILPAEPRPSPEPFENYLITSPTWLSWDEKYTFTSFVVGGSNQFAYAACQAVAQQPGVCYNPLFIFGGAGLGKTHLLKAIGYEILKRERSFRIIYVTTESFTNELIQAIRLDKTKEFREKYRAGCDVLLLDDIQFLNGKERTLEEFFYTFNFLHESKKQIVITADRYPKDFEGLEARLQSRFEWGLVADIQPPDVETRVAILKNKAELEQIAVTDEIAYYIATKVTSNIRELEGTLHRLQAFSSLSQIPISLSLAQQILKDVVVKKVKELSPESILKLVALQFGIKTTDLKSDKRARKLSFPRQIAMYLLRKHLLLSFPEIGRVFGGKDHTTVLHAVSKISEVLKSDPETVNTVTQIESLLR